MAQRNGNPISGPLRTDANAGGPLRAKAVFAGKPPHQALVQPQIVNSIGMQLPASISYYNNTIICR